MCCSINEAARQINVIQLNGLNPTQLQHIIDATHIQASSGPITTVH